MPLPLRSSLLSAGRHALATALLLAAGLGAACSRTPVDGGEPATAAGPGGAEPVQMAEAFEATTWKVDPYAIEDAAVEGNELRLVVRHGGGCATHRFGLAVSRAFRESSPVQVSAVLTHDANGDNCRAVLTKTLRFDLTPLRDAYRAAYRTERGSVVIQLWHQSRALRYDF